ncbi:MAG: NAD(P)/FAD-dependent oxidoreductase, partial [Sedimentisphaerales bacterium]|nr:NAD(P)/FAD-dependent oxidoreductase [Sedimentisphaerales bacterium]
MAAIHSAGSGADAVVVEGNPIAGRKLLLTGGGRCNFTHVAAIDELVRAFGAKGSPSSVASS